MSKSVRRVEDALRAAGLEPGIQRMPQSTRTAAEAARACGCEVGRIVKSLVFEREGSGELVLLLVSGAHDVDLLRADELCGAALARADPKRVRAETGFAIGGVAPVGHLCEIDVWIDVALTRYDHVWAAAGAPDAVFRIEPDTLKSIAKARVFNVGG